MSAVRRGVRALVAVAALAAGCGDDSSTDAAATPAEQVPELGDRLDAVDDAVVAGDDEEARRQVEELMRVAERAGEEDTLSDTDVQQIVDAGETMLAALDGTEPPPPPVSTTAPPPDDGDGGDSGDGDDEKPEKPDTEKPEKGPKPDKGKGKGH